MRSGELGPTETYIESLYANEDPGLTAVRRRLEGAGRWGVNIGANEGRILQLLMRLSGARRVVEIGTLYGYSAVWLARALAADGHLFTLERDPECARNARLAFEQCSVSDRVTLLEGDALESLRELGAQAPFDLVFIDANKSAYPDYLTWADAHVRVGGLIVADNTFLGGAVFSATKPENMSMKQWSGMRSFNERLADPRKYQSVILPTTEGLSIARKV
jgi:predicted O-methyltransferase YrrM